MVRGGYSCDLIFGRYGSLFKRHLTSISVVYFLEKSIFLILSCAIPFVKGQVTFCNMMKNIKLFLSQIDKFIVNQGLINEI